MAQHASDIYHIIPRPGLTKRLTLWVTHILSYLEVNCNVINIRNVQHKGEIKTRSNWQYDFSVIGTVTNYVLYDITVCGPWYLERRFPIIKLSTSNLIKIRYSCGHYDRLWKDLFDRITSTLVTSSESTNVQFIERTVQYGTVQCKNGQYAVHYIRKIHVYQKKAG